MSLSIQTPAQDPTACQIASLQGDEADAVWALYQRVQATTRFGFLAQRQLADFVQIVTGQTPGVAVGAFKNGILLGYSFSRLLRADTPLARIFGFDAATAYEGMGSAIDAQINGRLIMARMLALRGQIESGKGGAHVVGLIDTANLASVANVLRSGGVLVGTRRDATSLNYVAYGGVLVQRQPDVAPETEVLVTELEAQRRLFGAGWAANGLRRKGSEQIFSFARFGSTFDPIGAQLTEV